jgi:hypothetical protein
MAQILNTIYNYDGVSSDDIVGSGGLGIGAAGIELLSQVLALPTGSKAVKVEFLGTVNATEVDFDPGDPGPEYIDVELYRVIGTTETMVHSRKYMTRTNAINENNDPVHQDLDPTAALLFVDKLPTGTTGSITYLIKGKTDQINGTLKVARRQSVFTVLDA